MVRLIAFTMLLVGASGYAFATAVPEIDANTGATGIALISGALLVVGARRKK
jgi:hypothetical protein